MANEFPQSDSKCDFWARGQDEAKDTKMSSRDMIQLCPDPKDDPSRKALAAQICDAWRSSVAEIVKTGRLLIEAKEALDHGQFQAMIDDDLPFGRRAAQMLMAIASDPRLTNTKHASLLPPSWYTLYEISRLDDATFEVAIEDGTINPEAQRADIERCKRVISRDLMIKEAAVMSERRIEELKIIAERGETGFAGDHFNIIIKTFPRITIEQLEGLAQCRNLIAGTFLRARKRGL